MATISILDRMLITVCILLFIAVPQFSCQPTTDCLGERGCSTKCEDSLEGGDAASDIRSLRQKLLQLENKLDYLKHEQEFAFQRLETKLDTLKQDQQTTLQRFESNIESWKQGIGSSIESLKRTHNSLLQTVSQGFTNVNTSNSRILSSFSSLQVNKTPEQCPSPPPPPDLSILCRGDAPGDTTYTRYTDCGDIWRYSSKRNGTYFIQPAGAPSAFEVYCEMHLNEAWTVIQRRYDGSVNFYRNWDDYKNGFGNLTTEFWLGNEKIHFLTDQAVYNLNIDREDWTGNASPISCPSFKVASERMNYTLKVPDDYYDYPSTARGDSASGLRSHQGPFATYDRGSHRDCASQFHTGWWFMRCSVTINLNGQYYRGGYDDKGVHRKDGIFWPNINQSLKKVTMKLQKRRY